MPFTIVRQDITRMDVDAIVNAANTDLQMGGGVCGAIFKAAGASELQAACDKLSPIKTGEAVITPGFQLRAKFVIHAAGPVYNQWSKEQSKEYLQACYMNSLNLAAENDCESITFPLISSGIYGYPKEEALAVATETIKEWLNKRELDVYLAIFDKEAFSISESLLGEVKSYIDENYVHLHEARRFGYPAPAAKPHRDKKVVSDSETIVEAAFIKPLLAAEPAMEYNAPPKGIDDVIGNLDESFSNTLLRLIDAKGRTDVDVYKKANLDRKLFSKIRTGNAYMPSKRTAVALAVSLELTIDETNDLLARAGFTLSHSQIFDVIVEYFIIKGKYNIFEINEVLFKYDQQLLGG